MGSVFDVLKIRYSVIAITLLFIVCSGCRSASSNSYIVFYKINDEELTSIYSSLLENHGDYILELVDKNYIKQAGPINDSVGIAIYNCKSLQEVNSLVFNDPAVKQNLIKPKIFKWDLVFK